jgi:signal transduction histidine kinase
MFAPTLWSLMTPGPARRVGLGTGLGLVISNRTVANRHGGEIEFEAPYGLQFTAK